MSAPIPSANHSPPCSWGIAVAWASMAFCGGFSLILKQMSVTLRAVVKQHILSPSRRSVLGSLYGDYVTKKMVELWLNVSGVDVGKAEQFFCIQPM